VIGSENNDVMTAVRWASSSTGGLGDDVLTAVVAMTCSPAARGTINCWRRR
jgi:hypothetical protein